jgi:S-DNA-T family DNA segregation ATPase FtsK/SpoIIIE
VNRALPRPAAATHGSPGDAPEPPTGEIALRPPPELDRFEGSGGIAMSAIPLLGGVGSLVLVATSGSGEHGRQYVAAGIFLLATIGLLLVQIDRQRRRKEDSVGGKRADYLCYLASIRERARAAGEQQRRALTWHHPAPSALPSLAAERSRLWERTASDPRFLQVRYGLRPQPLSLTLVAPDGATSARVDPAAASALDRLLTVHGRQPDLPDSLDLRASGTIELCGSAEGARAAARALICAAAAFHSPARLLLAVLTTEAGRAHWDWVKWLPHARSDRATDAVGPRRMVATSLDDLTALLPADLLDRPPPDAGAGAGERTLAPHVLIVVDGVTVVPRDTELPLEGLHGVTVLDLPSRWDDHIGDGGLRLQLDDPEPGATSVSASLLRGRADPCRVLVDQCDLAVAEAFTRRLAPLPAGTADTTSSDPATATGSSSLMDLLGLGDVQALDPASSWRQRPARDRLRVPIGLDDDGFPVHLDLKESAHQGMGPHGMVIGATGSGKSELLRTLVLGLALTHSPQQLAMVLVDFKGGATFAGMAALPHVSAVITNLASDLTLVDRMQDALSGELVRRQELLRAAGNVSSIEEYETARRADQTRADLPPLASLLIIVDEFSEMLAAKPEFIDLFVAIGRLGRSLGLHLLLASQRLDEGRLRGLESHLSYRIALRTFSAHESRAVLGTSDAAELPATPGLGYLVSGPSSKVRFRATYVSGPVPRATPVRRQQARVILPFTITPVRGPDHAEAAAPPPAEPQSATGAADASLLDLAVARMAGHGPPVHQVWLPPLDVPDTLDRLLPDLALDARSGLTSPTWRAAGGLVVPLGTVDRPREQRRDTLSVDLGGAGGHAAVVGGPRTGKSTLLRTLVASLSLTTTPLESQIFVLDFGGGTIAAMNRLPHVAGVGTRAEPDVVRRIVAEVSTIIDRREAYFRDAGIDSIESYRARRRSTSTGGHDEGYDDGYGDVFLVIDGWATLRSDFDDLEMELQQLAERGLTFGFHLLTAATRWTDYRAAMRDMLGTRLELRLGDPADSEIDRRLANLVPLGRPGRGLVSERLHFLAALPRIDGDQSAATLGSGIDDLVERVRAAWKGPAGPTLRLLPDRIDIDQVHAAAGVNAAAPGGPLLLGVTEPDLAPLGLDPDAEPHVLVFGDGGSGKTALLRAYAREIVRTRTPKQAQLVVVDYRRTLLGEVPDDYLLDYLTSAGQATASLDELAGYLRTRLPGHEVTPGQLRARTWWSGAEVFVLVDDYDLVATAQGSPVHALQPLLAQARDVGLHTVVARRAGGASRALYEPIVQTLRDLAAPGLLLSGDPSEGPLVGTARAVPSPPGRGRLVTRAGGTDIVQLAWTNPVL